MVDLQNRTNLAYTSLANEYSSICLERQHYIHAIDGLVQPLLTGKNILDVGSGDGQRIHRLVQLARPSTVRCLEPSDGMYALLLSNTSFPALLQPAQVFNPALRNNFDVVTCLWNVLGHIPYADLPATLLHLNAYLVTNGVLVFDVNNRHNRCYGRLVCLYRRILDHFFFDPTRGDAIFSKSVGDSSTTLYGHLFTYREVSDLLRLAGFTVAHHCTVDYATGGISSGLHDGQHFFVAIKA